MTKVSEAIPATQREAALKSSVAALRDAGLPYALAGSYAYWARGGTPPAPDEDIDFLLREADLLEAAKALEAAGFSIEVPQEAWLVKAWQDAPHSDERMLVDLIYVLHGELVDDALLARADVRRLNGIDMPVMSATDIVVSKLLAHNEQYLDLAPLTQMARGMREQIHWQAVEAAARQSPFARGWLEIVRGLGIIAERGTDTGAGAGAGARAGAAGAGAGTGSGDGSSAIRDPASATVATPHRDELLRYLSGKG